MIECNKINRHIVSSLVISFSTFQFIIQLTQFDEQLNSCAKLNMAKYHSYVFFRLKKNKKK